MRRALVVIAALALVGCGSVAEPEVMPVPTDLQLSIAATPMPTPTPTPAPTPVPSPVTISEFSIPFPHADYRNTNMSLVAQKLDGTVIPPGGTFSMGAIVGETTYEKGYVDGGYIDDGDFTLAPGGGSSQVAAAIYNAAHLAGYEDVEHYPHSFYIDRYPMGREATYPWPEGDLAFTNNTPYEATLSVVVERSAPGGQGLVLARITSVPYWQVESLIGEPYNLIPSDCGDGFDVEVLRLISREGAIVDKDLQIVRYQPVPCE
jgi:hypothetical protein